MDRDPNFNPLNPVYVFPGVGGGASKGMEDEVLVSAFSYVRSLSDPGYV